MWLYIQLMKIAGLIIFGLATMLAGAAQTNDWPVCRYHLRVFGAHAVDLTPLFQWWQRQPAAGKEASYSAADIDIDSNAPAVTDRPLSAWHHLTGKHVGTTTAGTWVIEAEIYTSPTSRTNARIILNHPPVQEEQNYYTLKAQLAEANLEITNSQKTYQADVKTAQTDQQREQSYGRYRTRRAEVDAQIYAQQASQKQDNASTAASNKQQLETMRTQIEQQLKTIPAEDGKYYFDWFAVMVGRTKSGVPIYDLGQVSSNPP